ncbi:MAG: hypothetical protein ABFC89_01425 [Methanospirillum sp.]
MCRPGSIAGAEDRATRRRRKPETSSAPPDPSLPARLRELHARLPLAGGRPNALLALPDDRVHYQFQPYPAAGKWPDPRDFFVRDRSCTGVRHVSHYTRFTRLDSEPRWEAIPDYPGEGQRPRPRADGDHGHLQASDRTGAAKV